MQETVDSRVVGERVSDWLQRLSQLRQTIASWAASSPGLSVEDIKPAIMHEQMMSEHGIPDAEMPVFKVLCGKNGSALFKPKDLWVIGANGRVDIVTSREAPILVDESEPLSGAPRWKLYRNKMQGAAVDFTREEFLKLLAVE